MEAVQQPQVSGLQAVGLTKPLWAASCPGQEVLSKTNRTALTPIFGHTTGSVQPANGPLRARLMAGCWVLGVVWGHREELDRPLLSGSSQSTCDRVVRGAGTEGSMGAVELGHVASP